MIKAGRSVLSMTIATAITVAIVACNGNGEGNQASGTTLATTPAPTFTPSPSPTATPAPSPTPLATPTATPIPTHSVWVLATDGLNIRPDPSIKSEVLRVAAFRSELRVYSQSEDVNGALWHRLVQGEEWIQAIWLTDIEPPEPYVVLDTSFDVVPLEGLSVREKAYWLATRRPIVEAGASGDYSEALDKADDLIAQHSADTALYIWRARAFILGFDDAELALNDLSRVSVAFLPDIDAQAFVFTAMQAFRILNDPVSAVGIGQDMERLGIGHDDDQVTYAEALVEVGLFDETIDRVARIVERSPGYASAYRVRADAYDGLGKHELARKDRERYQRLSR